MSEDEFWGSTPRAFFNRYQGFTEWTKQREEERIKWDIWLMCQHSSFHFKKPLKFERIINRLFGGKSETLSKEERNEIEDRIRKRYKLEKRWQKD